MRQVTKWCSNQKDIEFAKVQLEKYGTKAILQSEIRKGRETGKVAYFRED